MNYKLKPFPGGELVVKRLATSMLLNLVVPKTEEEEYKIAIYQKPGHGKTDIQKLRLGYGITNNAIKLDNIIKSFASQNAIIYVESRKSIEHLFSIEKRGTAKKSGSDKQHDTGTKKSRVSIPRITSSVRGWKGEHSAYRLEVALTILLEEDPVLASLVCLAGKEPPFQPNQRTSAQFIFDISTSDQDDLVESIEETLLSSPASLSTNTISRAVKRFYEDPYSCVIHLLGGKEWPTVESIEKEIVQYEKKLSKFRIVDHLGEIRYQLSVPPILLEETYHLQVRIETSLYPFSLDLECAITEIGTDDKLYKKLLEHLPDGAVETKGDGVGSIRFPYGALVDVGQVFTYGECAEMFRRIKITRS